MKKHKIFLILIIIPIAIFSQSRMIITDQRKLNELINNPDTPLIFQSPLVLKDTILFFYRGKAKSVTLAGDFNNWQENLILQETRSNLWTIEWNSRLPAGEYKYRFKIDGFWIADPENPDFTFDQGREKLSLLRLTNEFTPLKKYPFWISNNTYLFRHHSTNADIVSIAGDFNNWNPYSHPMKYKGAGYFELELELNPKKIYLYSFVVDGVWTFDNNNKKQFRNSLNRPVSAFFADQEKSIP